MFLYYHDGIYLSFFVYLGYPSISLVRLVWVAINYFSLLLSGTSLFFLHSWKIALLGKVFWVGSYFSFRTLNTSFQSLLACKVSVERSAVNLVRSRKKWPHALSFQRSEFFVLCFWKLDYNLIEFFPGHIYLGSHRNLCIWTSISFSKFGKVSAVILLNMVTKALLLLCVKFQNSILVHVMVLQRS